MDTAKTEKITIYLARILSFVFHPLFFPIYGLAIIFTAPTFLEYLPASVKRILFMIVLANNVMIPVVMLPLLRNRNIISTYIIDDRNERIIPLVMLSVLYIITSFVIFRIHVPLIIKSFMFAVTLLTVIVTLITFWWKISIHSMATGSIIAMIIMLSIKMYTPLTWYLVTAILIGGCILSARLLLGSHNPAQVWAGFATGFLGLTAVMLIF
ncbi:MAG: hypothetical protein RBR81_04960 [Bacteroidales bacterium]|jgi:hypothetical protein|nr:hypothetical protein [Bacteroidales bacterium]